MHIPPPFANHRRNREGAHPCAPTLSRWRQHLAAALLAGSLGVGGPVFAQNFVALDVSGFNQDVVAESGDTSVANLQSVTTSGIDTGGMVLYSRAFAQANMVTNPALPDDGRIVADGATYRLQPYDGNNALLLVSGASGTLTLGTPQPVQTLRFVGFSAEAPSDVTVRVNFEGGSFEESVAHFKDWFFGTPYLANGLGRVSRDTGQLEAFADEPRLYAVDVPVSAANQQRRVLSVAFTVQNNSQAAIPNRIAVLAVAAISPGAAVPSLGAGALLALGLLAAGLGAAHLRRHKA